MIRLEHLIEAAVREERERCAAWCEDLAIHFGRLGGLTSADSRSACAACHRAIMLNKWPFPEIKETK